MPLLPRLRRHLLPSWRGLVWRLPVYAALPLLALCLFQDRLLHHPSVQTSEQVQSTAAGSNLQPWPDLGSFRGYLREPAGGAAGGTVVLFHGNGGHAGGRASYADRLEAQGLRTVLAEYPGYGARDGGLDENTLAGDAAETIRRAYKQFGPPVVVAGESLGAGVAAAAVARAGDQTAGLMLITPWDELLHVAQHRFPWLPVRLLLRDRYDSIGNLLNFRGPVVVVLGEHDQVIPVALGRRLHDALLQDKRLFVFPSGHMDWMAHVDAAWWQQVVGFLLGRQATE